MEKPGDFFYFDPPYISNMGIYTATALFTMDDQYALRDTCLKLKGMGIHGMVSNDDSEAVRKMFKGFDIHVIKALRNMDKKSVAESLILF